MASTFQVLLKLVFQPKSLLALLTVLSFLVTFLGIALKYGAGLVKFGNALLWFGVPIFIFCFVIWALFVFLSIARNIR